MWFTVEEEKPDIGTVIFKADDYYERLQHITGMWNDNKFLYYEMLASDDEDKVREKKKEAAKLFSVSDITNVPFLLAYMEKANLKKAIHPDAVSYMWDLHQLYVKKMAEFGHAINHMTKKEYSMMENRLKWENLMRTLERYHKNTLRGQKAAKKLRRRLKPAEIKPYYSIDSPPSTPPDQTTKGKKKGKKRKVKTQWRLFMKEKLRHPYGWDFGKTLLYDRTHIYRIGEQCEMSRIYHKIKRAIRFAKYEPIEWRTIALEEVDKHRSLNDCWMVIKNRVYDVTPYLHSHPGGAHLIMQGAGIDSTRLFDSIHPYVVFYDHLIGMQIGTLPNYEEHHRTDWEQPVTFNVCRGLKEWLFRPRQRLAKYQPKTKLRQFETHYTYTVSFPKDLLSREEDWTITVIKGFQVTIMKYIDQNLPHVWYGGIDLRHKAIHDVLLSKFSESFNTVEIEIKKPFLTLVRKPIKDVRQDHGFFLNTYSLKDKFQATVVQRKILAPGILLYGISVGLNQMVGSPVGTYVNLYFQGHVRPYTPICLPDEFENPYISKSGFFHTLFFIIKEFKNGDFTSMLHYIPTTAIVKGLDMYMSPAMGNFNTKFLFTNVNVMLLLAGGTGISVMTKIIQEYIRQKDKMSGKTVILFCFTQSRHDLIWKPLWKKFSKKFKWFHYYYSLTRVYRYSIDEKPDNDLNETSAPGVNGTTVPPPNPRNKSRKSVKDAVTVMQTNNDKPQELYGYPATPKMEYIYGQIGGANEAQQHKAIVCGPFGFNHNCKRMLKEFGKHSEENTWYFAA